MEAWKKDVLINELYHHGVLGMKWGVRRYQNKDGTLTEAGKRRASAKSYSYEEPTNSSTVLKSKNSGRGIKVKSFSNESAAEDYENVGNVLNATKTLTDRSSKIVRDRRNAEIEKAKEKIDLSQMSDAELQRAVNRLNLERSYRSLSTENIKTGKDTASNILSTTGDVLALGASAATLAYTIYKIRAGF